MATIHHLGPARAQERGETSPRSAPVSFVRPIPVEHLRSIFDGRPDPDAQTRIAYREKVLRRQETIGALCLLLALGTVVYFAAELLRVVL